MDLANIVCKAKAPECEICPVSQDCRSKGNHSNKRVKFFYKFKKRKIGVAFLLEYKDEWLIEHTEKRLLQGLYAFPMSDLIEEESKGLGENYFTDLILKWKKKHYIKTNHQMIGFVKHSFSHFNLKLLTVNIKLNEKIKFKNLHWMKIKNFKKKPVSTLVKKINRIIL